MEKHSIFKAYFGRTVRNFAVVTREAFDMFLDREVDSKISAYTLTGGTGFWEGNKEDTFILEVLAREVDSFLVGHQLTRIVKAYCEEFDQECVLVTKQDIDAVFISD